MFGWFLFALSLVGAIYGVVIILRDNRQGRAQGRGFGFDRDTQPVAYTALMTFNCVVVILLFGFAIFVGTGLIRHLMGR